MTVTTAKRRRGHGEGAIYQRENGRWAGAIDLGWKDGKRHRKVVYGATQSEVIAKMQKLHGDLARGLPVPDDQITVEQLVSRFLTDVLPDRITASTLIHYRIIAEKHIYPMIGSKRLSKLTPGDVQALLRHKLEHRLPRRVRMKGETVEIPQPGGYSPRTVRLIRGLLCQSINQAERWGIVWRNVASLTDGPRQVQREGRTLSPEQARALIAAARGDRLEAAFVLMLALGLRSGETLGLRWADIDLKLGRLTVNQALKREYAKLVLGPVKTPRSRRPVNLPPQVVPLLRVHRRAQARERLIAGEAWTDLGLCFPSSVGSPIDPRNFRVQFDAVCERAGLIGWHPHELRHSAASIMLAQGVPLEVVSRVLGHSSIRITADVYGHLLDPQRELAATAMSEALWKS
jgi:integrase